MFPSSIGILDIQSWWEVPSIAHFCYLFRQVFNLLDFDIEDLELSLLGDSEDDGSRRLLPSLIATLLNGCLQTCDVTTHNYQMYLRRLFRIKCEEQNLVNPFNSDIDFNFLSLRSKVEALYTLCDFRLEAIDVIDLFKTLDPESLRVEPLGYDKNGSAYWYFYGTRLYREDIQKSEESDAKKKSALESIWQVICFTEQDWINLVQHFESSNHISDVLLYKTLVENFIPEIPKLFRQKENQHRKRLINLQPRCISIRVHKKQSNLDNCNILNPRIVFKSDIEPEKYSFSYQNKSEQYCYTVMAPTTGHKNKPAKVTGRQTNNSLASATGQILIQSKANRSTTLQVPETEIYCQTDEDLQTGMYKILECLKSHDDAWPFIDPVEEEYAPNYYSIIRRPMDLQRMEEKLDSGEYNRFSEFRTDFQLLVNNCRLYNGQDNEYTEMVDNLQQVFIKATSRFLDQTSSDEELDFPSKPIPNNARGRPKFKEKDIKDKKSNTKSKRKIDTADESEPEQKHQRIQSESPRRKKKKISTKESPAPEVKVSSKPHKQVQKKPSMTESKRTKKDSQVHDSPDLSSIKVPDIKEDDVKSIKKDRKSSSESKTKHKKSSVTKSEKAEKRKVGRPSKKRKKSKYKKKHSKQSTKKHRRGKNLQKGSLLEKETLDSEDGMSSRSRSPTPLQSYSENSGSESLDFNSISKNQRQSHVKEKTITNEDKFDKIKERHKEKNRNTKVRDMFSDSDSVSCDKYEKKVSNVGERNLKLSDTIEKLRAKNEKSKENAVLFDEIFGNNQSKKSTDKKSKKDEYEFIDDSEKKLEKNSDKKVNKKTSKRHSTNNIAMDALDAETEQTLKDMNKWFTESQTGNTSQIKSDKVKINSDDPAPSLKKNQKEVKPVEKSNIKKDNKDITKRKYLRDSMKQLFHKKRDIQRTIDRLQPGKSKGNLINATNMQPIIKPPAEEVTSLSIKCKEIDTQVPEVVSETCPKLSLGSVLPTEGFGLVQQHNFNDDEHVKQKPRPKEATQDKEDMTQVNEITSLRSNEEDEVFEKPFKVCQEKATPNLSAWFKAFGAPKNQKKKSDEVEDTQTQPLTSTQNASQSGSIPDNSEKFTTTKPLETEPEYPDNQSINVESPESSQTPRTRRTSTGSTISDRSNFSQDLDSPKINVDERMSTHNLPYPSPLNKNIAQSRISPKSEDIQKSINVGFYQDTTKNSPEKSCSPQERTTPIQGSVLPSSLHIYSSKHSPNPLQAYPYSNITYDHGNRIGADSPLSYYDSSKLSEFKPSTSQDNNIDYASQSTKECTPSNISYIPQNNQLPYNNRHLTNQALLKPNSPFSYSNQSSPYSNSDLSSPYGTPQPNSPYSHQTLQSSPNPVTSNTYPMKKRCYNDENPNTGNQPLSSPTIPGIQEEVSTYGGKITNESMLKVNEAIVKNTEVLHSSITELINMGYSKADNKLVQVSSTEMANSSIKNATVDNCKRVDYLNDETKNLSNDIKTNLDRTSNKSVDLFQSKPTVSYAQSGNPAHIIACSQNESQKCTNVINMSYQHTSANIIQKSAVKMDNLDIINNKQKDPMQAINTDRPETSTYADSYSKNLSRVNVMGINESNAKNLTPPSSNPLGSKLTVTTQEQSPCQPMAHKEFIGYSQRNFNIPGLNIDMSQCNSNIHMPNSLSNIDSRIPGNSHIGLTLNEPSMMHARNFDMHNTGSSNIVHNNPNYKFDANSSAILDPMRKLTNLSQVDALSDSGCHSAPVPNYYDAKTLQLQTQNAQAASLASMQMFPQSQSVPMTYNRQPTINTQGMNNQPHMQNPVETAKIAQPAAKKTKSRKKKAVIESDVTAHQQGFQSYASVKPINNESTANIPLKTKHIHGSAFNFGPSQAPLNIPSALYNTNETYLEDYRPNNNPYYMAHRATPEQEKGGRPAQTIPQFQYLSAPSSRTTDYPFISSTPSGLVDSSSPIYQQYLQRHQEDLLRQQTNAQIMLNQGLLTNANAYASPRYAALGMRQAFDPMSPRPPWL